jgi:Ran GTPase-activating protein (RanGAP) involved in mRNA processing and transport
MGNKYSQAFKKGL